MQSTRPQKIKMFCSLRQSHNSASPDSLNLKFLRDPWTRYLELVNHVISKLFQLSECQFQMTVKPGSSTRGELDTSLSWWSSPLPPSSPLPSSSPWPSIIRLFFYSEESASASRTSMAMSNRCPQLQSVVLRRSFQATIQTPATCGWWIWFKNIVLTLWIQVIIIIIVLTIIIVNIIITLCQNVFSSKSDQDS